MTIPRGTSRLLAVVATLGAVLGPWAAAPTQAQATSAPYDSGALGLGLALRHLDVDGGLLYVAAYPGDEDNGALVKYQRGRGIKVGLLTATRGEGGKNEIGPELSEALGVLRTEELAAVHRYDGAQQFFTRAVDRGASASADETLQKWGHDEVLQDIVWVLRVFRPDVVLTTNGVGPGGGQQQAVARLAHEAFRAAADSSRFPGQIERGLRPWQARKLYQRVVRDGREDVKGALAVDGKSHDLLLGMSWDELGARARASHRCQGASHVGRPGVGRHLYELIDSEPRIEGPGSDVFRGVDTSLRRWVGLAGSRGARLLKEDVATIESAARQARKAFDVQAPHETVAPLAAGLTAVRELHKKVRAAGLSRAVRTELLFRLARKRDDFVDALGLALGLEFDVTVDDGDAVPGQGVGVIADVRNRSPGPVLVDRVVLEAPEGWIVEREAGWAEQIESGAGLRLEFLVRVGPEARFSQPYWSRNPGADRYQIEIPEHQTLPWSPPRLVGTLRYTAGGVSARLVRPAHYRCEGPRASGRKEKVLNVVPALSLSLVPETTVVPLSSPVAAREFRVELLSNAKAPASASVRLEAPEGWQVVPAAQTVDLEQEGDVATARFLVTPPRVAEAGDIEVRAVATLDGREYRDGYQVIAYDHIQERHLFRPAVSRVTSEDAR